MTVKQYRKKVDIARRTGTAMLDAGCILHYHGEYGWSVVDKNGNTIDTGYNPGRFEYLFEK